MAIYESEKIYFINFFVSGNKCKGTKNNIFR